MWHRVAPVLADDRTVVLTDLRGYGDTGRPASTADHAAYSKRAMAADQVARDARARARAVRAGRARPRRPRRAPPALDHPDAVSRVAVLDIVPTRHVFAHVDRALATAYWHWFFLAQANRPARALIGARPGLLPPPQARRGGARRRAIDAFAPEAVDEYVRCFSDPDMIQASCEDYRAGASHRPRARRGGRQAGRRVACPGARPVGRAGLRRAAYDALEVWRDYAADVRGHSVPGGHFLAEDAPRRPSAPCGRFLREPGA